MLLLLLAARIDVLLGLAGGRCCWTGRVDLAWWELGRVHGIQTGTFGGQAGCRTGASPLLCRFLRHTRSRMASPHHHIITSSHMFPPAELSLTRGGEFGPPGPMQL